MAKSVEEVLKELRSMGVKVELEVVGYRKGREAKMENEHQEIINENYQALYEHLVRKEIHNLGAKEESGEDDAE